MTTSSTPKQSNTNRKLVERHTASAKPRLHNEAARRRAAQRQRQKVLQRMRPFESLLPDIPSGARVPLPRIELGPLWRTLTSRLLWIVIGVAAVIGGLTAWVSLDERWYVYREDVHFNGLNYLDAEELWVLSDIDGWQIFWIDGDEVRRRLLQNPYVADARVYISPLVTKITADVTEVRPVALWVTDAGVRWLRDDGLALEPRGATPPGLLEILDAPADATLPGAAKGAAIDPAVLHSAQALANRMPGVAPLRYNALVGLNFRLPGSPYWVYWGDDENVEKKLENLAAAETLLARGEAQGSVIDVRFERPYIK
ncbi:MAG: FtsQ-type POTRA domain-containing protein [Caldilinea sp.]|jgi:cell division protein FtsQ|nr:FtsQ-type POTRA domain-containing protein [Caldilinea sp.]